VSDDSGELNGSSGSPRTAVSEALRIAELHAYQVLDTDPEPAFDGLVQAAAAIAEVPRALVSLVDTDRQWFKARLGMAATEGDRESTFCDLVVQSGQEMIIPDAAADLRFVDNPLVTAQDGSGSMPVSRCRRRPGPCSARSA
jgi:GAF domain-containing protein